MDSEQQSKRLAQIIREFENKNWLTLKTTSDLAKFIVEEKGFCPTTKATRYQEGIYTAIKLLQNSIDEEYEIADKKDIQNIIVFLNNLLKEQRLDGTQSVR